MKIYTHLGHEIDFTNFVEVEILWNTDVFIDGKCNFPIWYRYNPLILFEGKHDLENAWSADIITSDNTDENKLTALMSYVSKDAPFSSFKMGSTFKLYEGKKCVASGIILTDLIES